MTQPKRYSWILFDADGTLFDYDRAEVKALEGSFRDFGLPYSGRTAAAYREINHQVWVDFENGRVTAEALRVLRFSRLFEAEGIAADAQAFSARYLFHLSRAADLIDGAEGVVRALAGRARMAMITNGLKDVQRPRLALSPIADFFDEVAISEELGVAKPSARFFDIVLDRIGRPPRDQILVVGDSLTSDIQGGMNAGIDTCWFNPTGQPILPRLEPAFVIQSLSQLLTLIP